MGTGGLAEPASNARYAVLSWLCLAATVAYICRNSIGVAESTIRRDLGLTEKQMGAVMGLFFLSYALGQIPTGWLGNWWGSRLSMPLCAIGWSLATAALGLASGVVSLVAARLANGLAQAGLFPCATNTISKWFPPNRRAVASGALGAFMSFGGAIGVGRSGWRVGEGGGALGWRLTFVLFSLLGIVWSVGFFVWFRDLPQQHGGVNAAELALIYDEKPIPTGGDGRESTPWLAMISSPATGCICGQQFCRAAGQIFFASWFATFLQETRGVSIEASGMLNSLPLIALVAGALSGGMVSDGVLTISGSRRLARQGVAAGSMFACALFVFAAYTVEQPLLAVVTISAGTFCAAVGGPCAYSITIDMGARHVATLFGLMNMVGNLGALAFIYGVPYLTQAAGWNSVLLLFAFLYLGACLFWLFLNPTGDIFEQSWFPNTRRAPPERT